MVDMEIETLVPPWVVELARDDDGRLVEVKIRATGDDDELGFDTVREATNAVLSKLRQERGGPVIPYPPSSMRLRRAWDVADGKMTPGYLAQLAVTYADIARRTRAVMPRLSEAIGKPAATVKGHVVKAREQGYLSEATTGTQGGEPTDKAWRVLKGEPPEGDSPTD